MFVSTCSSLQMLILKACQRRPARPPAQRRAIVFIPSVFGGETESSTAGGGSGRSQPQSFLQKLEEEHF